MSVCILVHVQIDKPTENMLTVYLNRGKISESDVKNICKYAHTYILNSCRNADYNFAKKKTSHACVLTNS